MITGLNHITLAVTDIRNSLRFYCSVLGCKEIHVWSSGAYLQAGSLWLCLSVCDVVDSRRDYTHLAFGADKDDMASIASRLRDFGAQFWKENESEGESLYFLDPDGHKLEIHIGSLSSRMNYIRQSKKRSSTCGAGE